MSVKTVILAALLTFADAAGNQRRAAAQPDAQTLCYTNYGPSPCPSGVTTRYFTTQVPKIIKSTSVVTSTRHPVTITSIVTSIVTKVGREKTQTVIQTITDVDTETAVTYTTIQATVDDGTSTSDIPAPTGFIPIVDSLNGSSYSGAGGPAGPSKRGLTDHNSSNATNKLFEGSCPKRVACYVKVPETSTKTVISTATVAGPTSTATKTKVVTSRNNPSAPNTVTIETTVFSTSVTTSTSTVTQTLTEQTVIPFYQQCDVSNLADTYDGNRLAEIQSIQSYQGYSSLRQIDTAYDCCVAATVQQANSAIFAFFPDVGGDRYCLFYYQNTCADQSNDQWLAFSGDAGYGQMTTGNGPCGLVDSTAFYIPFHS